jgi:antitoxin component YwqK of YwqJK toxin-antitoxin module
MKRILIKLSAALTLTALLLSCDSDHTGKEKAAVNKDSSAAKTIAAQDTAPPRNGMYEKKYDDGAVKIRGEMRNGKREGSWFSYYSNGKIWSQTDYIDGLRNGQSITWFPNGKKRYEGIYTNDKQSGTWKYYDETGKTVQEVDYDKPTAK